MDRLYKNGIIKKINKDDITVEILSCSACSSCMVKNYCTGFENKQKEFIIKNENSDDFEIGEEIFISINERQVFKSIVIAYIIPLILTILTIVGALEYTSNEIIGGICGIIILIPYYFGLFLLRNKFRADFKFIVSAPRTTQGRN